jgi:hypothetical protein
MFRAAYHSSSGALTEFAASGLYTRVVTGRCPGWVGSGISHPTRCNLVIEFIIPKFTEGSTCFERYTAYHQELQTVFAASGLYTRVVTGRCPGWMGRGSSHPAWTTAGHHTGI